ncbi:RNA polymerase II subunit (nucleomorph) [Chroomonas mesostigmatica CCMP1168]|uniref:RNA polymerase II subunit n=1 Tax=Chroomonas mesostigmatica CCMP1168 TaxID=1195612 RepID=J7G806_9CRYP|nr:RNA polymerase II subunit [Chroomonas mesostigmatica CCMP1168]
MEASRILVNEIFIVEEIDMVPTKINNVLTKVKNKIFSKVSRIFASSISRKIQILIDINTEIYKIQEGDILELSIVFPPFLNIEGIKCNENSNSSIEKLFLNSHDLIDSYEYVMYGTVYHSGIDGINFFIYASFGGLLMKIFGKNDKPETNVESIQIDSKILLCIRKQ